MFLKLCLLTLIAFAQTPGGPNQNGPGGSNQNVAMGSMTLDGNLNIRECNSPCCTDFYDDANVAIESNVKYGSAFHLDGTTPYELFMDIYEVEERNAADPFKNTKKPVAVFVHGGGFSPDSHKDDEVSVEGCTGWAKRGFVCVSVEYRRWGGVSGATNLRTRTDPALDLQAALRYLVKEADKIGYDSANGLGIDAEQIILYGGSAGGLTISSALLLNATKVAAKVHEIDVSNWNLGYPSSEFCSRNATSVNCHCQFDPARMHEDGCNSGNWGSLGIENVKGVIVNSGGIDIPYLDSGLEACMQRPYFGMHYEGDTRVNYNKATTAKTLLDRLNTPNSLLTAPGSSHVLRVFEVPGYANSLLFDDIYAFALQQLSTTCPLTDGANVQPCVDIDQESPVVASESPSRSPTVDVATKSPSRSPTVDVATESPSRSPTVDIATKSPSRSPTIDVATKSPSSVSPDVKTGDLSNAPTTKPTEIPSPTPSPDYVLVSFGATACPSGFAYITNLNECNLARRALDVNRWYGETFQKHSHRMPFCWVGSGPSANYNPSGDLGATAISSGSRLICKRDDSTHNPTVKPTDNPVSVNCNIVDAINYNPGSDGHEDCDFGHVCSYFETYTIIDVRSSEHASADGFECAANLPVHKGRQTQAVLEASGGWNNPIAVYSYVGAQAAEAVTVLQDAGFTNVVNIGRHDQIKAQGCKCPSDAPTLAPTPAPTPAPTSAPTSSSDGADYVLASTGATACPRGFAYITNRDECNLARKSLDAVDGWNGESLKTHSHRMPFCWVGRGKKANYNPSGDWGAAFSGSSLICKRYEFALIDGAPGSGQSPAEVSNPDPTQALGEVQCCQRNGVCTRSWPNANAFGMKGCLSGKDDDRKYTLQDAVGICGQLGSDWDLCTRAQTNNDNCKHKGCMHDHKLVWVKESTMKVVNPAPERFALIDGAPNGGSKVAEYANPDPTEKLGEVQCCQVNGLCTRRFPWSLHPQKDCLSGSDDASKFTLQEAVDMCKNLGAEWSLCTREQTNNGKCQGKGCMHDSALVWVNDHS